MSNELPFVSCLCPSYRRPTLLANSIACFLAQDYPADRREMLILDDSGRAMSHEGEGWRLISVTTRMKCQPTVFNSLANIARGSIFFVWEDDDCFLPWHISASVEIILSERQVSPLGPALIHSKPSKVLSTYGRSLSEEEATGRFHSSIAMTRSAYHKVGGWPDTRKPEFDQMLISALKEQTQQVDPCVIAPPSYCYRWEDTNCSHASGYIDGPGDDGLWYQRYAKETKFEEHYPERIVPKFDDVTLNIYKERKR